MALAVTAALCGCTDISHREFIYVPSPSETTDTADGVGGDLLVVTAASETEAETEPPKTNIDSLTYLTPEQQYYIDSCLFMGDSICSGFGAYGLVKNCAAKAGVAARNIDEFTFDSGDSQVSPYTAIVNSGCKKLVFLMGINDVNTESANEYIEYYSSFLKRVEALTTGTTVYILSITPVTENSTFCYNYQIEEFNSGLKTLAEGPSRHYVDITAELKDENGSLRPEYASDNSVHLTKEAYYKILEALCKEIGG